MTARVEQYIERLGRWIPHDVYYEGKHVKGVLPDSQTLFDADILPAGQGFKTIINGKTTVVGPDQAAVQYWSKHFASKRNHSTFRLIPT